MDTDDAVLLRAIVDRARDVDPAAWAELYRRAYPRLFAYARRRLASEQQAEDAVSETMMRAMAGIGTFRWSGAGFDGWHFGIARNVVFEMYRESARSSSSEVGDLPEKATAESGPLEQLVADDERRLMRFAFDRLPAQDRELLELRVLAGLDANSVGSVLGRRPGTVRVGPVARAPPVTSGVRGTVDMSRHESFWDDGRAEDQLGEALGYDPHREPPPERMAQLRVAAEQLRTARARRPASAPAPEPSADVAALPSRRTWIIGIAATSVGVAAGAAGTALLGSGDNRPTAGPPTEPIDFATAGGAVRADARLINHTWGTELLIDVTGVPAGATYRVRYQPKQGPAVEAGSFLGVPNVVMKCRFNAATLRAQLGSILVQDEQGAVVLRADLA